MVRLTEGKRVVVDIYNDTDTPEQLHWHGQFVPADVDGAAEEGTPYIPAHGMRRISFAPEPSGFRFYHTHVAPMNNLSLGTYTGQAGPVYIEPLNNPGAYDREVFLVLKEFLPSFSQGGDMAMDFLVGEPINELQDIGKKADAQFGGPKGYEVGYDLFGINGKMLGHGEPIRVKQGERVLFHVLNASSGEIRSLALPGHVFKVVTLDGNPVPTQAEVPALWLGTSERISAIVEMKHPGVWVMGDLSDDDRGHGMGIVVEYANAKGKPQWSKPRPYKWDYTIFGKAGATLASPDETMEFTVVKHNGALDGFNQWLLNDKAFSMETLKPVYTVHEEQARRRQADGRSHQGRGDDGRLPGGRVRFRRRSSRADAIPLSPAAAHGFWLHVPVPIRVTALTDMNDDMEGKRPIAAAGELKLGRLLDRQIDRLGAG
jgi:FtsP/CotA-like multicopper oxidase with cupredoxin domain